MEFKKAEIYKKYELPHTSQSDLETRFMSGIDAAIAAIAFGQLYLEGTIDKDFKLTTLTSIKREFDLRNTLVLIASIFY